MKICFVGLHKYWGGINNSGGSKTIIKSAEALRKLGHKVDIAAVNDRHTWVKHPPIIHKIPKGTDVAIANSVSDIDIVLKSKAKRKFWWCRGIEKWQMPKDKIMKKAKKISVIVNATHLLKHFPKAKVCYAGLDLDFWGTKPWLELKNTIGFMKYEKHKTKRNDLMDKLKKKYSTIELNIKGKCNDKELKELYRSIDIYVAPTELEGFHNVPAEACLCGCLIVCNRRDSNGMGDYATDETAMRYTGWDELLEAIENPNFSKVAKMQKLLKEKIGNREKNMKRFVRLIK